MIELPQPQGLLNWLKESVTVKLIFIGALTLMLLIPSLLVMNLTDERSRRQEEMELDISDKWSGSQLIQGPVLVIPYKKFIKEKDTNNKEITKETIENAYILPGTLNFKSTVKSKILNRGIFETVVYNTLVKVDGDFKAELNKLSITPEQLLLNRAKITFSISDLKGLKTNPIIKSNNQTLQAEPVFNEKGLFSNGLQASIDLTGAIEKTIPFTFTLDLKGSQELRFLHSGKTTTVDVTGDWKTPSFDGRYLPDDRKVNDKGFTAKWRMLYFNRPFAQQWADNDTLLNAMHNHEDALFGVKLKLPVDQYQKTMRTSKYGILIILLTFISLFLTEMISKQKIHVFNYILIGAALVIYYTLLLSFAEQVGFNWAYLIASTATIALVAGFIASLLKNKKAAILFTLILTIFYVFIYVIIQLEDLALLIGSVALFVIVSILMYFSRKINWDNQ
ncbi:MAG: cell envelope integrity protein CreD [Sphingobacteriaceae bacterium]|nr:MAG: cell envelope integrity protein CreD [Sphingobacteriaceae bacterium]